MAEETLRIKTAGDYDFVESIDNDKFTEDNTRVIAIAPEVFNAYHSFAVLNSHNDEVLGEVHFQEGPVKENALNGIFNEDLILMVITRLEQFQQSEYACEENAQAIDYLYKAIDALRARTNDRKARGVEGTSTV